MSRRSFALRQEQVESSVLGPRPRSSVESLAIDSLLRDGQARLRKLEPAADFVQVLARSRLQPFFGTRAVPLGRRDVDLGRGLGQIGEHRDAVVLDLYEAGRDRERLLPGAAPVV